MIGPRKSGATPDPFAVPVYFPGGGRGELLAELADLELLPLWTVVHGPVGSGRTALLDALGERLPDTVDVVVLTGTNVESVAEFQGQLASALGVELDTALAEPEALAEVLLGLGSGDNACAILVDDADLLEADALAWLDQVVRIAERISSTQMSLHLLLFGTEALCDTLRSVLGEVRYEGRVRALELVPLDAPTLRAYLRFRFNAAGIPHGRALDDDDLAQVVGGARGLPALANTLARRCWLQRDRQRRQRRLLLAGVGVLVLLVAAVMLRPAGDDTEVRPLQVSPPAARQPAAVDEVSPEVAVESLQPPAEPVPREPEVAASETAEPERSEPERSDPERSDPEPLQPEFAEAESLAAAEAEPDAAASEAPEPGASGQAFADRPGGRYVLQLLGTSSAENAAAWVEEQDEPSRFLVLTAAREGRPWYLVVYGDYDDRQQAVEAAYQVAGATGTSPWVRAVEAIRADLDD